MYETLPPLFSSLSAHDLETAMQRFQSIDVQQGMIIMEEGEPDPTMVVVQRGELDVATGDTRLGRAGSGDLVGEMSLFTGDVRTATVTCRSDCRLLLLDQPNYLWLRRVEHPVALAIEEHALKTLSNRLRAVGDRIARLAEGTPAEHVTPAPGFFDRVASVFGSGGLSAVGSVDAAAVLARSPLFAGEPAEILAEVGKHFVPMAARRGHFLCTEGETGNDMYVLAEGAVDVVVATSNDKVEQVATLEPGEAFGMCALVQPGQPRMASCVVKEGVTALVMDKITWAEQAPRGDIVGSVFRVAMIRALCDQLSYANAQLAMLDMSKPDLGALLRAGAGVEAHGRYLAEGADDVPDYLKGV